ncbi:hypothetical protein PsAD5_04011 [Pseudovibrio sp. Ad5]|nr:hypothetical protein PsAD5_04011 [Pseudovibrio sp. Ad5]
MFSDADSSDTHTITLDASGTTGEVSLIDGKFQYDPNGQFEHLAVGETAIDTFTYTVSDGTAEPITKTVTVTINGADDIVLFPEIGEVRVYPIPVKLFASDASTYDYFGSTVSVNSSGGMVVGAHQGDGRVNNSGSAYVYAPDGKDGYLEVKLSASDGEKGDRFGVAAINDNGLVVVGAYGDDQNGVAYGGSVYVYTPDGVGGYSEYKLPSLYERERDYWGESLAVNNSGVIVVGAYLANYGAIEDTGRDRVYTPSEAGGYSVTWLQASDTAEDDYFGGMLRSVTVASL